MGQSGGFAAFGADKHHFAGVDGGFNLKKSTLLTHSSGFCMFGCNVASFDNNFAFGRAYFKYLAFFAFISSGDDDEREYTPGRSISSISISPMEKLPDLLSTVTPG